MNKIVIIGPPGAGKTEFANSLGQILQIKNVYHLDFHFWKRGSSPTNWIPTSKQERNRFIEEKTQASEWIIEGNFLDTLDTQLAHADLVIWLDLNPFLCLYRVLKRYFSYIGKQVPEIATGCQDKLTLKFLLSIFLYKFVDSKAVRQKLEIPNLPALVVLQTPKAVEAFLKKEGLKNPK